MRIDGIVGIKGVGLAGKRAMIEKQIKQLEQRRDRLLRKITGEEEPKQADVSAGTAAVAGKMIHAQAPAGAQMVSNIQQSDSVNVRQKHASQVGAINDALGIRSISEVVGSEIADLEQPVAVDSGTNDDSSLRDLAQSTRQSGGGDGGEVDLDAVTKELESINSQIMQLQQQLSQETLTEEMEAMGKSGGAVNASASPVIPGMPQSGQESSPAQLPPAVITATGHLDGYV
jgi:hypothetical protein